MHREVPFRAQILMLPSGVCDYYRYEDLFWLGSSGEGHKEAGFVSAWKACKLDFSPALEKSSPHWAEAALLG